MSRLSKLYEAIETMRKENVATQDMEIKVSEAEEEIIKKEILPVLSQTIAPALQPVKRELVLVVDYIPGKPLSVHLSRRFKVTEGIPDAKEMVLDPAVEHGTHKLHVEKVKKSPASSLSVTFPDGTIFTDSFATEILTNVVKKIGVGRVRSVVEQLGLKFSKVPVISNRIDPKYGASQKDLGGGWFLITHTSNRSKKKFIETVSDALHLGLKVHLE